jgi:hypothetical protein
MSIDVREGKNKRFKKRNEIKFKWMNKKPIEPCVLVKHGCECYGNMDRCKLWQQELFLGWTKI